MLNELIAAVTSRTERQTLGRHPEQVSARLDWVVRDRGLTNPRKILEEIQGAETAIGVLLTSGGVEVLPPALVPSEV